MKKLILFVCIMFLVVSCNDDNDDKKSTETGELYTIGILTGELSDNIENEMPLLEHDGVSSDKAFIIDESRIGQLTDNEKKAVMESFANNNPIVLLYPTENQINELLTLLETGTTHQLTSQRADFYAIDKEADGEYWQLTIYPTPDQASIETEIESTDGTTTSAGSETVNLVATESHHTFIVNQLQSWLEQNANRSNDEEKLAAAASENEITDLANAFNDTVSFPYTRDGNSASFQFTHSSYSCRASDGNDWFIVIQDCVLSPSNLYAEHTSKHAYWYVEKYDINMQPSNSASTMIQSKPDTTTGSTTVTATISKNISGTVSYKQGPSVTGGMSMSNSTTFNIPDVSVHNLSGDDPVPNNARWQYTIPRAKGINDSCENSITSPKSISHETFQPTNAWIWMMPKSSEGSSALTVNLNFNLELADTYCTSDCNVFGCDCDISQRTLNPQYQHSFNINYPNYSTE